MKSTTLMGLALAVLGILALVYQGFSYTRHRDVLDVGPIHATVDDNKRVSLPPIVGGLALAGGVAFLLVGAKKKA